MYSRIEKETMRNVKHTIEWKVNVKTRQNGIDYEVDILLLLNSGYAVEFLNVQDTDAADLDKVLDNIGSASQKSRLRHLADLDLVIRN